jgi:type II secretory pathway pseudopilin PulG
MERCNGFSLVELVIVAGLTAVVLAGLGGLTLISDVQLGRRSNSNSIQETQEQWGRAVTFIQNEAADAASLSEPLSPVDVCEGFATNPVLILNGPPTAPATIIYGVRRPNTPEERGLYRGPYLLIRCGPFPGEPEPLNRVLLDGLTDEDSLQVQLLGSGQPFLDAKVTITLTTGTNSTYASDQPFRVHAQLSP